MDSTKVSPCSVVTAPVKAGGPPHLALRGGVPPPLSHIAVPSGTLCVSIVTRHEASAAPTALEHITPPTTLTTVIESSVPPWESDSSHLGRSGAAAAERFEEAAGLRRRPFAAAPTSNISGAVSSVSTSHRSISSSDDSSGSVKDFFDAFNEGSITSSAAETFRSRNPVLSARVRGRADYVGLEDKWNNLGPVKLAFEAAGLGIKQQNDFLAALTNCSYKRGEYIVREGDAGDAFYMITSGEVSVTHRFDANSIAESAADAGVLKRDADGDVVITHLYEGHFFGEVSLLTSEPRNANVKATTAIVTCRRLSQADFLHFVSTDHSFCRLIESFVETKEATKKKRLEMIAAASISAGEDDAHAPQHAVDIVRTVQKARMEDGRVIVNGYILEMKLGSGSFGDVWLAKKMSSEELVAIKVISRRALLRAKRFSRNAGEGSSDDDAAVLSEVAVMKRLTHRNVVRLYEVIDDPDSDMIYLVQEYCELGPIFTENEYNSPLQPELVRAYMRDICSGLEYLHFQGICHRDLKPSNILIASDGTAKISDFGASAIVQSGCSGMFSDVKGTPAYSPPEIFSEGARYSGIAADLWSLGATLHTMAVGVPPFMAATEIALVKKLVHDEVCLSAKAMLLDPHLKNLLLRCLDKDPSSRATLYEVSTHAWITEEGAAPLVRAPYKRIDLFSISRAIPPASIMSILPASDSHRVISQNESGNEEGSSSSRVESTIAAAKASHLAELRLRQVDLFRTVECMTETDLSQLARQARLPFHDWSPRIENMYLDADGRITDVSLTEDSIVLQGTDERAASKSQELIQKKSNYSLVSSGDASDTSDLTDDTRKSRLVRTRDFLMVTQKDPLCSASGLVRKIMLSAKGDDGSLSIMGGHMSPSDKTLKITRRCSRGSSGNKSSESARPLSQVRSYGRLSLTQSSNTLLRNEANNRETSCIVDTDDKSSLSSDSSNDYEGIEQLLSGSDDLVQNETTAQLLIRTANALGHLDAKGLSPLEHASGTSKALPPRKHLEALTGAERDAWLVAQRQGFSATFSSGVVQQPEDVARRANVAKAATPNAYTHTRGFLLRAASWRDSHGDDSGDVPAGDSAQGPGASASGPPCWHAQYVSDRLVCCPVWVHETQGIAYGAAESIGKRLSQEDRCVAVPSLRTTFPDAMGPDVKDAALFVILDGHGGSATSELLTQMLPPAVAKALARPGASAQAALAEACRDVETRLPDPVADESCSGSTACIVLLTNGDTPRVVCANVGDSRAVLFRRGLPVPLSTDHKVSEPRERARILAAGGSITNNRLNGVLSVSRAFGDKEHKAHRGGEMWGTVFSADPCSAEPEFTERELSDEDDFVVVACDGLWDVLSNEEVGCFLMRRLTASRDVAGAARDLVAKALDIGSSDNISAIVISFSRGLRRAGGRGEGGSNAESTVEISQ